MFVLKISRVEEGLKGFSGKESVFRSKWQGWVPASRTARFWRCWTWLFFIFPVDAATVHSEAQETRRARCKSHWRKSLGPKKPSWCEIGSLNQTTKCRFCSAFFLVKICGFSLFESTPKLSQFARWWLTALVWSSKEGRFDCWRDLHHGPWWPLHAIAMIVLYPENQPLFLKAKSSTPGKQTWHGGWPGFLPRIAIPLVVNNWSVTWTRLKGSC